ncbi:MAG: Calx-beta domain-containing protein, partial [Roseiflexaceae bacterium]
GERPRRARCRPAEKSDEFATAHASRPNLRMTSQLLDNSTLDQRDANPGDGSCSSTPSSKCTLRAAIQEANASAGVPDTISLPAGVYTLTRVGANEDAALTGDLNIAYNSGGVYIYGSSLDQVIIDGGGIDRVFEVCCQTNLLHMEELTIRNGRLQPGRLGFYDHGHGAGIHNHGVVELKNVTISGNTVDNSGSTNTWGGGGITNGCGLAPVPGRQSCALHAHGDMTLTNVTISGNRVIGAGKGGGIENGATLRLTNVTIADNSAPPNNGGGISNNNTTDGITSPRNTIIANSPLGGNCLGTFNSLGYNISSDGSCAFGASGDRNSVDPRLGPLGDYGGSTATHPLLGGPAIDGGTATTSPPSDQRGVARQDGNLNGATSYDIGAYELEPVDMRISYMSASSDPVRAGDSLIYTIDVRNSSPSIATGITLIDTLPAGVSFNNYAETRGGSCLHASGVLTCGLTSLRSGFVWSIYLYVTVNPTTSGTISNSAVAGAAGADPSPANDGANETTSVTPLPSVRFSAASYNVGEGAGTATITAQLSAASDRQVTVHYAASNGTAIAPGDYSASAGTLTFDPGQTSKSFPVSIANDALHEPNETVQLALSEPGGAILGTPASAALTIVDNDVAAAPSSSIYLPLVRR